MAMKPLSYYSIQQCVPIKENATRITQVVLRYFYLSKFPKYITTSSLESHRYYKEVYTTIKEHVEHNETERISVRDITEDFMYINGHVIWRTWDEEEKELVERFS